MVSIGTEYCIDGKRYTVNQQSGDRYQLISDDAKDSKWLAEWEISFPLYPCPVELVLGLPPPGGPPPPPVTEIVKGLPPSAGGVTDTPIWDETVCARYGESGKLNPPCTDWGGETIPGWTLEKWETCKKKCTNSEKPPTEIKPSNGVTPQQGGGVTLPASDTAVSTSEDVTAAIRAVNSKGSASQGGQQTSFDFSKIFTTKTIAIAGAAIVAFLLIIALLFRGKK